MHYRCLLILILGPVLCRVAEACGRTPATPRPTPPPDSASTTPLPTEPAPLPPHHRINCTPSEWDRTACLSGGSCFVVVIAGDRVASCQCPKPYIGDRCQELSPNIFDTTLHDPGRIATASIAGSIVLLVIVTFVVVICLVYHVRKKKKRQAQSEELSKIYDEPDARAKPHNGNNTGNKKEEEHLMLSKLEKEVV